MNYVCPTCGSAIDLDDVNVAQDVAPCRSCEKAVSMGQAVGDQPFSTVPPWGVWYDEKPDGFVVGATTLSSKGCWMFPLVCVWSTMAFSMTLGAQIATRDFSSPFVSFMGLLVISVAVGMFAYFLMSIAGYVEVRVSGDDGEIFTGVGPVGWRNRFSWSGVVSVSEGITRSPKRIYRSIRIMGEQPCRFGRLLNDQRRCFLIGRLRRELQHRSKFKAVHDSEL